MLRQRVRPEVAGPMTSSGGASSKRLPAVIAGSSAFADDDRDDSQLDDHAVCGGFVGHLGAARQHVVAHMGEHEALRPDLAEMLLQERQRHVSLNRLVARISLADEEVGFASDLDQHIGPFRIAGKGDDLAFDFEAEAEAGPGAIVMHDMKRRHARGADLAALADFKLDEVQGKVQLHRPGAGEAAFHHVGKACFQSGRPDDGQRPRALGDVIGLEQEKRQPGNVIGMKMRDENDVDVVAVNRKLVHGDKRGRAAIDQRVDLVADEMEAGVESSPGAEGITAADELQVHGMSPRSSRQQLLVCPGTSIRDHRLAQCRVKTGRNP
jgi:hypothetical protein